MRWYSCFLVALVSLGAVVSQDATDAKLDAGTLDWLNEILKVQETTTTTSPPPVPGTNALDPAALDWLNKVLSVSKTTTNTAVNGTNALDPAALDWLNKVLSGSNTTTTAVPENKFNNPNLDPAFNESGACVTDKGENGMCVSLHQCTDGVIDNTTLIDLRDGTCPHYLQTCCLWSASKSVKPDVAPATECGWSNPGASVFRDRNPDNINRKTYADYGEFPWMVALMRVGAGEDEAWKQSDYYGGGAIIHPSVVITVAHKVDWQHPRQIKCRAGEWDTQTILELYPTQDRIVNEIILHEEYYRTPAVNDVALLILESPFVLKDAPHIGVACLAHAPPAPGTLCHSMGWGTDFLNKNKPSAILKKVDLSYVEPDKCLAALRATKLGPRYTLQSSHLCAGGVPGVDTCKGDGGSSLVCPIQEGADSSRYAVYGLVAFGVGCGTTAPSVHANIPHLYQWVTNKMHQKRLSTSSYTYKL